MISHTCILFQLEMCFLSNNIYDYNNVSQGKITIPNMDDGEEFAATDVSVAQNNYHHYT